MWTMNLLASVRDMLDSLPIMGYGMAGIFLCIVVIMLCIFILGKVFPEKKDKK